jgi:hypothetical protein
MALGTRRVCFRSVRPPIRHSQQAIVDNDWKIITRPCDHAAARVQLFARYKDRMFLQSDPPPHETTDCADSDR